MKAGVPLPTHHCHDPLALLVPTDQQRPFAAPHLYRRIVRARKLLGRIDSNLQNPFNSWVTPQGLLIRRLSIEYPGRHMRRNALLNVVGFPGRSLRRSTTEAPVNSQTPWYVHHSTSPTR